MGPWRATDSIRDAAAGASEGQLRTGVGNTTDGDTSDGGGAPMKEGSSFFSVFFSSFFSVEGGVFMILLFVGYLVILWLHLFSGCSALFVLSFQLLAKAT